MKVLGITEIIQIAKAQRERKEKEAQRQRTCREKAALTQRLFENSNGIHIGKSKRA